MVVQEKRQRVVTVTFSPVYKRYDLGKQQAGTIVEVVLSCMNNVRLMDDENFRRYAEQKTFKSLGGRIEKSPTRFTIPMTGNWHVVVDKAGFQALANSNVRAIPPRKMRAVNGVHRSVTPIPMSGEVIARRPDSEAVIVSRILSELHTYKHIANTDALTGLANRRAFDARMAEIFASPDALAASTLILTDIDHFKSFNDTHGHAVGDMVLKRVAETIRANLPDTAFPARTGGEEFAIVLEGSARDDAVGIAEILRRAIEAAAFVDETSGADCGPVTISLGLCMAAEAESVADLYNKSDSALYASKKAGRNRCTVYDDGLQTLAVPANRPEPIIYNARTSRISTT